MQLFLTVLSSRDKYEFADAAQFCSVLDLSLWLIGLGFGVWVDEYGMGFFLFLLFVQQLYIFKPYNLLTQRQSI